jgi:type 1 glutamine amidotransferase
LLAAARLGAACGGLLAATLATGRAVGEEPAVRRIVFIAGPQSHGYGAHEHYAGCVLLAETLRQVPGVACEVVRNGWPADDRLLDAADAVVIYADGGTSHPAVARMDRLAGLMQRGAGLTCIHYGVEVPRGPVGDRFLEWLGGYFETDWSVNPHWRAEYGELVEHPITRGVDAFRAQDEWYYHMRFPAGMSGVQPILSAVPPQETLTRPDGPHSGNPHVRAAVARGESQHTAWAYERRGGGRSFGFTGGHFHWNWGRPEMRKLVANAILWTAHGEVPPDGVPAAPLSFAKLKEHQDEPEPADLSADAIAEEFLLEWPAEAGAGG